MDTRLKKFDLSMITKTVCFLLAIIFAALGTANVLNVLFEIEKDEDNNVHFYGNILTQGKNFDLPTSEMFVSVYQDFVETAIENAFIYSDGSKKAYEEYLKRYNEYNLSNINAAKKELKKELLKASGTISVYKILDEFSKGAISLEKIADHKTHIFSPGIYVFDKGGDRLYFLSDNGYEVEIAEDGNVVDAYYTIEKGGTKYSYKDYEDSFIFSFTKSSGIPESVSSKAKNADGVIELCRTSLDGSGVDFDGYYSFTVNEDYLIANISEYSLDNSDGSEFNFFKNFESYSDFKEQAGRNAKELASYKNLTFAVADNKTGKILATTLPGTNKNMSINDIEKACLSNEWSVTRNFETGKEKHGKLFENIAQSNPGLFPYNGALSYDEISLSQSSKPFTLSISFDTSLKGEDMLSSMQAKYFKTYNFIKSNFITFTVYLLGFLICVIILIIKSGRKSTDNELHMLKTDGIFTILRTAVNALLIAALAYAFFLIADGFNHSNFSQLIIVSCSVISAVIAALLIDWLMYIARHIKNHTLLKNILIVKVSQKLWSAFKKRKEKFKAKIKDRKERNALRPAVYKDIYTDVIKKVMLGIFLPNFVVGLLLLLLIGFAGALAPFIFLTVLLFGYDIFVLLSIIKYAYHLRKIFYALNQIRSGNYDIQIDKTKMPQSVKAYANDVEAIREGLKLAVENAVMEQRTKTELITNVSHDLKTPLTSVITYVDLLSRCDINDETAKGYIEVLGEKSARLKRLIEDLVEASKAQTGNINVSLIKVSLKELISQVTGEYEDELNAKNLSLILTMPDDDVNVMADSKMCYRVLDNLFGNIKKYALENTRVYVDLSKENGKGIITIRNISKNQLNIAPEELMARFVRGDSSRSTEGSGLGLSIAENFCRLQGGELSLDITGDLFTAKVSYLLA